METHAHYPEHQVVLGMSPLRKPTLNVLHARRYHAASP
jgi:hypothetical protein